MKRLHNKTMQRIGLRPTADRQGVGQTRGRDVSSIPVVKGKRTTYENFVVDCPECGMEIVFNRASDLGTFEPIAGRDVSCPETACRKPFRIVGDSINEAYELFLYDTQELRDQKRYMTCILNIAQAYEVFFGLFFRVELLYRPFGSESGRDLFELNRLAQELHTMIKDHAFGRMRSLFLSHLVKGRSPGSLADARTVIAQLPCRPSDPPDADIDAFSDTRLVPLLKAIKATKIATLRNNVVHKRAYRPTLEEVDDSLETAGSTLLPLGSRLDLHDEINWYLRTR